MLDLLLLPPESRPYSTFGRISMAVLLLCTFFIARHSRAQPQRARISAGLLLGLPGAFYALILFSLPAGRHTLVGYGFIPYMLVAMLAIFPFTLIESAVLGLAFIGLQLASQQVSGTLMTAMGMQETWLLSAILVIVLTANYFQLGLMLRLYREATHDPLTGLLNRGALLRTMQQASTLAPTPRIALLMMDLDYFKRINDAYGHMFGDQVLRHFASVLQRCLRPPDMAARYGGEEFLAVLVDVDKQTAMQIAEDIRERAQDAVLFDGKGNEVRYTVSIGVATLQPGERFETAARRADNRLYDAKRATRNCVVGI